MHIEALELENFRGFNKIFLEKIPKKLVIIVGINGAGKSSILDAISCFLSYIIYCLNPEKNLINVPKLLEDKDINNESLFTKLQIKTNFGYCQIHKKKGTQWQDTTVSENSHADLKKHLVFIQKSWQENSQYNIPLFVYYPVNRKVANISLETPKKDYSRQIDAYSQGRKGLVIDFSGFFQWFRQREDIENEFRLNQDNNYRDKQLETVRNAILQLMPNFTSFRVRRSPPPLSLTLIKNGESLVINQLSDGEKSLIAMIGDLAKRLVIANPSLDDPLEGEGIVLIDEIELHLHPQWQREIIPKLLTIFPNCQFFITTHSPQVLSNVQKESIFILEDFKVLAETPHSYGRDSNSILYDLFNVPNRPQHTQEIIDKMFDLMKNEDKYSLSEAKELLRELEASLGEEDTEIIRAKTHLDFVESFNEID
ncbi:putative ATP-binding protein involved in virulence [Xenococcus sp. PCC 7305]|uniref:AAA family ATPase n=1 Tax=Xenococcus sp. PCC 7305 TaxID=102125 RepID=UPI0002AC1EB0|nr:AAA family ATPase [Xenococcus sp. PCC 7305]ELS00881.1 putative ATP-binding protein involved in virulence [Xenococcus sp. PCC 7305]